MAVPHDAVGWAAVCDCGMSCSYLLTLCIMIAFSKCYGFDEEERAGSFTLCLKTVSVM